MSTPFLGSSSDNTRQQLRAKRFLRVSRDVFVLNPKQLDLQTRMKAARLVVPGGVACLWTAAMLTRLPVADDGKVHLARARGTARSVRADLEVHRFALRPDEWFEIDGLP